jgi:HSP20 family protein
LEVDVMASATLTRWDPFQQLAEMQHEFDRVLGRPLHNGERAHAWVPPVDVEQTKDALVLKFDLPGVKEKDVTIELEGRTLLISGERKEQKEAQHEGYYSRERLIGRFTRSFMLPEEIEESKIDARFHDGMLTIRVPRLAQQKKPRRIAIKASA